MRKGKRNEDYYVVEKGDTIESIAGRFLGEGLAPLLVQLNGIVDGSLQPGMVLLLHPEGCEKVK